jgi:hypothetical protein
MLSDSQVTDLYAAKSSKKKQRAHRKSLGKVFIEVEGKLVSQPVYKMGDFDFGKFEGKAGSIRRSRKGASRRLANGRRRYVNLTNEVIAYRLTK